MHRVSSSATLTLDELSLLQYAQHMARTTRSAAAKEMYEAFLKLERRRLAASGHQPATGSDLWPPQDEAVTVSSGVHDL